MAELHLGDEPRPYYLAYTISDLDQATVNATLGARHRLARLPRALLRTDLRVGDPSFDNTNFEGGRRASRPSRSRTTTRRCGASSGCAPTRPTRRRWRRWPASAPPRRGRRPRPRTTRRSATSRRSRPRTWRFRSRRARPIRRRCARRSASCRRCWPSSRRSTARTSAAPSPSSAAGCSRSEGTWVDDYKRTVRIDVVADTQADDGMKLRSFVPFTALDPAGLAAAGRDGEGGAGHGQGAGGDAHARRWRPRARAPCCSRGWPRRSW